ncbi:response regulator [Geodermatophilus sabuli]|uniref:Hpt domain-containing protein n=1 Tax=Geodermatophilus sabuli TaxID=1564158 RepID=A0A285E876_9ACTN|nr:response regulator [Geodermatophilus sabuli]MBB3082829.1 CheY-like chemotaxis protein [Geodermatophilus sabuli]SNX94306.1 Hpt domain-containing protein [Geodermatophilus sabuli]
MLTALVVDRDPADRSRIAGLLELTGWAVQEAADSRGALALARRQPLDLVVTDLPGSAGEGPALLRRLRLVGCRARLLVVTGEATAEDRGAALAAGALACLPKPVDADLLLDHLRRRAAAHPAAAPAGPNPAPWLPESPEDDVDAELRDRLKEIYVSALPDRLTAISAGARTGDTAAVAWASTTLAGTSAQLGYPEVAAVCRAIASDARRGLLAHDLVVELRAVAGA